MCLMFIFRQIVAYKNLIEALEHITIAMIYALGFLTNRTLNNIDYREFIRYNSLSQEHLVSAKHFLQRESIFESEIEMKLEEWYHEFTDYVMLSVDQASYFDNRHNTDFQPVENETRYAISYSNFMSSKVLPKIKEFQHEIKTNIRFAKLKNSDSI
jgi:hypothetical protein